MNPRGGRVLVVGDVMTDVIVQPEGPLVFGSDRRANIHTRPGGSGANQAVWLGAMGVDVCLLARVGAADIARFESYFRGFGVDPLLVADPEYESGVLVTLLDAAGERSFFTDRGANLALCPADASGALGDGTALLLLSGYSFFAEGPRAAVLALQVEARSRGIPVAIDPASVGFLEEVGPSKFLDWTAGADLLFANTDEARVLTGFGDLAEQVDRLLGYFERVIVKRGAAGAVFADRAGLRCQLAAEPATVVDSTGAGDAFAAGFIAAELTGAPAPEALAAGIAAGAVAVRQFGGQPLRKLADPTQG